jgi:hypothetical protein
MLASIFFLVHLFAFHATVLAQDREKQPLQKVLFGLERQHNVVFTYADKALNGIFVAPPSKNTKLSEALLYLGRSTGLLFQQLNERYITINKTETTLGLCGILTDAATGEKIVGATVHSGKLYSVSNWQGYFSLSGLHADSVVHIRSVGYTPLTATVKEWLGAPCKSISLQPNITLLQEVFVSDFIAEGIDKKVDGSFEINTETLGLLPGLTEPDVLQTIQKLPGIQSVNETISDINIRGGTNDQNLILWDGIRMYHSGHFFGLISAYNPYLTEKITLIKNGSSAALGDGVSGTIDIRTEDCVADKFYAGAGINMINGDVFAKIPFSKKMSAQFSARRSVADMLQTPTYNQYFERAFRDTDVTQISGADSVLGKKEKFIFYDTSVKLLYDLSPKDKLRFSFLNVFNDIEYQENTVINSIADTKTSGLEQHNLVSGLSYSRLWNDKIRTSAQAYLSAYNLSAVNYDLQNGQRLIQENNVLDNGIKLNTFASLSKHIGLLGGYHFTEVGVTNLEDINNPDFRRSIKKVVRTHAAFLEGSFFGDNTNLNVGVRTSYFNMFDKLIVEPRLSFNHHFLGHFNFEVLGEIKNQTTAQTIDLQTDFLGVEKRRWVLSNNASIPIVRSKHVSAGTYFKKDNLLMSVDGYYKLVDGIISSSQGFRDQFQYARTAGSYETIGVDFLVNKKIKRFTTWLSYTLAESTFEFPQLIPPTFPNSLDVRHRITSGMNYKTQSLECSAGLNWHSGKPFTAPVALNEVVNGAINFAIPNSSRLPNYLRLDLSVNYKFRIAKKFSAQAGASLWNALNKKNIINQYYVLNSGNQLETGQQSSLGITTNFNFRVSF